METTSSDVSKTVLQRSRGRLLINLVVSAAIFGGAFYGYTLLGKRSRPVRTKPKTSQATIVSIVPLEVHQGPVSISASGIVVPLREIRLASEITGRVISISENLRPGRSVLKGEVLVQIDPIEFELEVRRLHGQQSQERAELAAIDVSIENTKQLVDFAQVQVALATSERERSAALVARQAASASEVELTERAELASKSALVEHENRRRDLIAQRELTLEKQNLTNIELERAQLNLSRTKIVSPLDGQVIASSIEEQSFLATGVPFVTIEDTSSAEVRANLTVDQMVWVWNSGEGSEVDRVPSVPATIQYRAGSNVYQWNAVLHRIDGAGIDQATRTYPCLFRVEKPESFEVVADGQSDIDLPSNQGPQRLFRGMFVSVNVLVEPAQTLYQVPESAIRPGNRVWVNDGGGLRILPVQIVSHTNDYVIIDSPKFLLAGGGQDLAVVVSPISNPIEGMPILDSRLSSPAAVSAAPTPQIAEDGATPMTGKAATEKPVIDKAAG